MTAITDFSDQAVVLPLALLVALALLAAARPRAAGVFLAGLAALDVALASGKIVLHQCGPDALHSPSGHAAMAAYVWGGGAALLSGFSVARAALLAAALAALMGLTRVALGAHTPPEVLLGGALGVVTAAAAARSAGAYRPVPRAAAALLVVPLLLHGQHLRAEPALRMGAAWLDLCHKAG